jgi:hypothetical protein
MLIREYRALLRRQGKKARVSKSAGAKGRVASRSRARGSGRAVNAR